MFKPQLHNSQLRPYILFDYFIHLRGVFRDKYIKRIRFFEQEYGDYDAESAPRVRRRSSLSDTVPRVNNANFEDANMVSFSCLF